MTAQADALTRAQTLIEALPYIREYSGRTVLVKIGGEALEDRRLASLMADDLALLALVGIRLVVVHGGGPQVSRAMTSAGLSPTFIGGLRVTDAESIEILRQVLIGVINSDLVALLGGAGLQAVGLTGGDGGTIEAVQTAGPGGEDLGRVGRILRVDPRLLRTLLESAYTPVIASVAAASDGEFLNINADAVAGAIAAALGAAKLVYLTNVEGLYKDLGDRNSIVSELKMGELEAMLDGLSEGMQPKAQAAVDALRSGVGKVHILDGRVEHALLLEMFTDQGVGTQVLP